MNIQPTKQCVAPASTATVFTPKASNDLLQFIEKQEGYIEQLERESQFCRVFHSFLYTSFYSKPAKGANKAVQFSP